MTVSSRCLFHPVLKGGDGDDLSAAAPAKWEPATWRLWHERLLWDGGERLEELSAHLSRPRCTNTRLDLSPNLIHVNHCSGERGAYVNKALRRVFMYFAGDSAGQGGRDAFSQTGGLFSERGAGDRSNGTATCSFTLQISSRVLAVYVKPGQWLKG